MKVTRFAAVVTLMLLAACADDPTSPEAPRSAALTEAEPVSAAIVFNDTAAIPAAGLSLIQSVGGTLSTRLDSIGVVYALVSPAALTTLRSSGLVHSVSIDVERNFLPGVRVAGVELADGAKKPGPSTDPTTATRWPIQWNMRQVQADRAWAAGYFGSPGVKVFVLDTGIDYTNRELTGLVDLSLSRSFVPVNAGLPGDQPFMDDHFHGTHVGSTIVSNNVTVAGLAPFTTLVAVKVLSAAGVGLFEWIDAGIVYAADAGADVINMSLGAETDEEEDAAAIEATRRAIKYAEKKGAIVVSAAGNDGYNLDDPAHGFYVPCEVSTVCVSATGPLMQQNFDQPAEYTNYGLSAIDVAAPGGNASDTEEYVNEDLILGACSTRASDGTLVVCRTSGVNGYYYAYAAGTSMAAPHVAGVAAMILSKQPNLPVRTLVNRIFNSADDIGAPGADIYSNHGRVNVYRALGGN